MCRLWDAQFSCQLRVRIGTSGFSRPGPVSRGRRFSGILSSMVHWYRVIIESDHPVDAEQRAALFELALRNSLKMASGSPSVRVYYDWLPAQRGRVFWLSAGAFDAARDLARQQGAEPYPGLADMRYLVPMFD